MLSKKIALVILDGYGIGENNYKNAIHNADTQNINYLIKNYPSLQIAASEEEVGLGKNQFGNSEIGHLSIGSGRVILNNNAIINDLIKNDNYKNEKLDNIKSRRVHLIGLYSSGLVHSNFEHIEWLTKQLLKQDKQVILHLITDGRDTNMFEFKNFISRVELLLQNENVILGSVGGRYFAMDRDQRWERVQKAFDSMFVLNKNTKLTLQEIFKESFENDLSDEYIEPVSFEFTPLKQFDTVIIANYRSDRILQLGNLIQNANAYEYNNPHYVENVNLVTLFKFPKLNSDYLFEKQNLNNTLGDVLRKNQISQARIAETEKYPHVSFFFDGGIEKKYSSKKQYLIPSPKVATYDLKPQMSASLITQSVIDHYNDHDFFVINYANSDMVGHTGDMKATVLAVKTLDEQIKILYDHFKNNNGVIFLTSDHGNADIMLDEHDQKVTSHTINKVLFVITDKDVALDNETNYNITNIAPTILEYLNLEKPIEMTSKSMLIKK